MLDDTPVEPYLYCPECEPDIDPLTRLVSPRPCWRHQEATTPLNVSASNFGYGEDNRRWCDLIHRGIRS